MADVFISYHEDTGGELAERVAIALELAGISCWYARRDLKVLPEFPEVIPVEIERCKIFMILLTAGAVKSRHNQAELSFAFSRYERGNIQLLPVRFGNVPLSGGMRYYLARQQIMNAPPIPELVRRVAQILDTASGYRNVASGQQNVRLSS